MVDHSESDTQPAHRSKRAGRSRGSLLLIALTIAASSCGSPASTSSVWTTAGSAAPATESTSPTRTSAPRAADASSSQMAIAGRAAAAPASANDSASALGSTVPSHPATMADICADTENAFSIIQSRIFDRHSCSAAACHGDAAAGGLSLARGKAFDAIVTIKASLSDLQRVKPGAADESFLFHKLLAATEPGSVAVSGSPMPAGLPPLTSEELAAVRAWIDAGAPASGPVAAPDGKTAGNFVANVLCQTADAAATPDKPQLEPPDPRLGIQFRMPPTELDAGSEYEGCFATYYDVTDQVPEEFKSSNGVSFYVSSTAMRFAPGTHHTAATLPKITLESLTDPSFGQWTCRGGDMDGQGCNPKNLSACGGGMCTSTPLVVAGCVGYGPPGTDVNSAGFGLVQALNADAETQAIPGVYREVPLKGVVFWDFHGVNLQDKPQAMDGRINMTYANDRTQLERRLQIHGHLDGEYGVPPFKKQRLCNIYTAARGTEIIRMTSHTHHRGTNFRAWLPDGTQIYENHSYSEPAYITFEPAIKLDAEADVDRQIKFCADFNNGVTDNGEPDLDLLCQVSKTPDYELFLFVPTAVACSVGKWGQPCVDGLGDQQCETSPGAGDGKCDAAPIHYSTTTAGEMFLLSLDTVIRPEDAQEETLLTSYILGEPQPNQDL